MSDAKPDSAHTGDLLERIRRGDGSAVGELFERHRGELRRFVELHLDPRIRSRVDPSDVVQETQMELVRRLAEFLDRPPMPFRLWLRKKAYERLLDLRRNHLTRERRSVRREAGWPDESSLLLARPLLARGPSPSEEAQAHELSARLSQAVLRLSDQDREVLLMRHADDLPFDEIAYLLDIEPAAARKRFGRALIRLQSVLTDEGLLE
ncbi:MAG: sigma-70 family RNA polymerase sigma factor [Gemmataceae bacterium]